MNRKQSIQLIHGLKMKVDYMTFSVSGKAYAQPRQRAAINRFYNPNKKGSKKIINYTPKKAGVQAYKQNIAYAAMQAKVEAGFGANRKTDKFMVIVTINFQDKSQSKKKFSERPVILSNSVPKQFQALAAEVFSNLLLKPTRPDGDNLIKAIFDAMNNIVYDDDAQIVFSQSTKQYAKRDFVEVHVLRLRADYDSD